ncbi:MAG: ABC transporter substrate-binding protein [Bacillaceae bacterium]|nr:ABC transporter substrate-binding protein [Bacillaceae bacterium]
MRKAFKKSGRFVFLMLLAGILILAGCGQEGNNTGNNEGSENQAGDDQADTVHIGLTQIVEHPALDAARQGILDALADNGFEEGNNLVVDYQNAQNSRDTALTIAQKFVGDGVDVIGAIATPSAQAAVQAAMDKQIPVVFSAVTDPVEAGLVDSVENPGANVTGTSDAVPMSRQIELIQKFIPEVQTIGVIYNSGETNSNVQVEALEAAASEMGIQVERAGITNGSEVQQGAQSLAGKVEAIFIPTDNTVVSAFEGVLQAANDAGIPVFASDVDTVERGAVASYGMDYYKLGYQTGEMMVRILNGENPGDIPVEVSKEIDLVVNVQSAEQFGLEITDEIRDEAKELIGE